MNYPILYSPGETDFDNNGLGFLSDAIKCTVTSELSGFYELRMDYPATGIHFSEIEDQSILKVKLAQVGNPQLFKVYSITRPVTGIVTISAAHVSYDLGGIPVSPFKAGSAADAMGKLKENAAVACPFSLMTDLEAVGDYEVPVPKSMLACLRGGGRSIVKTYGGEFDIDNYTIKLKTRVGIDRGVRIRYGKNLTDIKQEQNCADIANALYPYWKGTQDEGLVQLPEKIIKFDTPLKFDRTKILDLSQKFEQKPSEAQIREYATKFANDNEIWRPRVNLSVSYVQLEQTDEYKGTALLERVFLGDTVGVDFPGLGVSTEARAVKIVYDVLLSRVDRVYLGNAPKTIADTLVEQMDEIKKVPTNTDLYNAVQNATNWITNGKGYMVAVKDAAGNWKEICSLDTPDIDTAVNVWRWNNGGFGFSKNGYNGPYETAITQDGKIVADFITTGSLSASLIKTGTLNADLITTGSMSANRITSGTMSANRISGGEIDANNVTVKNLDAGQITTGTFSADRIRTGTLQSTNGMVNMDLDNGKLDINGPNYDLTIQDGRIIGYTDNTGSGNETLRITPGTVFTGRTEPAKFESYKTPIKLNSAYGVEVNGAQFTHIGNWGYKVPFSNWDSIRNGAFVFTCNYGYGSAFGCKNGGDGYYLYMDYTKDRMTWVRVNNYGIVGYGDF